MIDIHIGSDVVWFMIAAYAVASIIALAVCFVIVRRALKHRRRFEKRKKEFDDIFSSATLNVHNRSSK